MGVINSLGYRQPHRVPPRQNEAGRFSLGLSVISDIQVVPSCTFWTPWPRQHSRLEPSDSRLARDQFLGASGTDRTWCSSWLDESERERAERFRVATSRNQNIVGRGMASRLLSSDPVDPRAIRFDVEPHGKALRDRTCRREATLQRCPHRRLGALWGRIQSATIWSESMWNGSADEPIRNWPTVTFPNPKSSTCVSSVTRTRVRTLLENLDVEGIVHQGDRHWPANTARRILPSKRSIPISLAFACSLQT